MKQQAKNAEKAKNTNKKSTKNATSKTPLNTSGNYDVKTEEQTKQREAKLLKQESVADDENSQNIR